MVSVRFEKYLYRGIAGNIMSRRAKRDGEEQQGQTRSRSRDAGPGKVSRHEQKA
jgi:hypothetical protein